MQRTRPPSLQSRCAYYASAGQLCVGTPNHRCPSTTQETQTIVPEDQVKLSTKELDEDITRFAG